ncbi:MAG: EAL domain-containing protein [Desulfuromonadales bacterium]|nr:EAL domain-containing protein [Desulfuromonadales bacterium]
MQAQSAQSSLLSRVERYRLVARARYFFVGLIMVYGIGAALSYLFSEYGFFLAPGQVVGGLVSLCLLVTYTSLCFVRAEAVAQKAGSDHLQVLLDLTVVSLLIHLSGGAGSWLWPLYLMVTLEAAILLEKPWQVWGLGLVGGACYGLVLAGESLGLLVNYPMPFTDLSLHHEGFYLSLKWLWVSLLCAATAVIGTYLMESLRQVHWRVHESESRLKGFLDAASDLIFSVDAQGRFLYTNRIWGETLGYTPDDLTAMRMADIIDPALRTKCMDEVDKALRGESLEILESRLISKSGATIAVEGSVTSGTASGEQNALWVICRDVSVRKQIEEQLYFMAHHDPLTGLVNRLSFNESLKQAEAQAQRHRTGFALLYLDLDRFKIINDTLGHAAGDALLQEVARRLQDCVRQVDTIGRLGGDEFAILLVDMEHPRDAVRVAEKIVRAAAEPIVIQDHELFMTTSIGISLYPEHGSHGLQLLKKADAAMYRAKVLGRNTYQVYDACMDEQEERRVLLENGLRQALEQEQFSLLYQPKVNMETGEISALEALIRWQHPKLGTLTPADFLTLTEENGMILPIGLWTIRQACLDNACWRSQGLPAVRVAVNLSGYQLQSGRLVEEVARILEETGLPGESLEFEVAETVVMQSPHLAARVLTQLRKLGAEIAIDDFGTGYSSLAHLKGFAVNTLKIDRAFVHEIESSPAGAEMTSAIIAMAGSLNLRVIAEGVETDGQYRILKEKHCDEMQGYLFSRPVPEAEVVALLRRGPGLTKVNLNGTGAGRPASLCQPPSPSP